MNPQTEPQSTTESSSYDQSPSDTEEVIHLQCFHVWL